MAYDSYSIEHHLTFDGWKTGSESYPQTADKDAEPPFDRVETWLLQVEQSSGWAPEIVSWQLIWHDPTKEEAVRQKLRYSFEVPGRNFPLNRN
jgi:hypothetical protein